MNIMSLSISLYLWAIIVSWDIPSHFWPINQVNSCRRNLRRNKTLSHYLSTLRIDTDKHCTLKKRWAGFWIKTLHNCRQSKWLAIQMQYRYNTDAIQMRYRCNTEMQYRDAIQRCNTEMQYRCNTEMQYRDAIQRCNTEMQYRDAIQRCNTEMQYRCNTEMQYMRRKR